jgi:hypothetical protein
MPPKKNLTKPAVRHSDKATDSARSRVRRGAHGGRNAGRFSFAVDRMCTCGAPFGEHTHESHQCPEGGRYFKPAGKKPALRYSLEVRANSTAINEVKADGESRTIATAIDSVRADHICQLLNADAKRDDAEHRLCRCPIGAQYGDCPFGYSNAWHAQRDDMLLRVEVTPEVLASIRAQRATMTAEELDQL